VAAASLPVDGRRAGVVREMRVLRAACGTVRLPSDFE
jgi:hypothetical protein